MNTHTVGENNIGKPIFEKIMVLYNLHYCTFLYCSLSSFGISSLLYLFICVYIVFALPTIVIAVSFPFLLSITIFGIVITLREAIQKRKYEPLYKPDTKN